MCSAETRLLQECHFVADGAHCIPQWSVFIITWVKLLEEQRFSYDQLGNSAVNGEGVHKNLHKER